MSVLQPMRFAFASNDWAISVSSALRAKGTEEKVESQECTRPTKKKATLQWIRALPFLSRCLLIEWRQCGNVCPQLVKHLSDRPHQGARGNLLNFTVPKNIFHDDVLSASTILIIIGKPDFFFFTTYAACAICALCLTSIIDSYLQGTDNQNNRNNIRCCQNQGHNFSMCHLNKSERMKTSEAYSWDLFAHLELEINVSDQHTVACTIINTHTESTLLRRAVTASSRDCAK